MKKKNIFLNFNYIKFKTKVLFNDISFFFYNIQRKNLKLFKFFDQRKIGSIPRIILSSLLVIFFFYSAPFLINYSNDNLFNTNEYKNNSKKILAYTLNNKDNGLNNENQILNEKLHQRILRILLWSKANDEDG